MAGVHPNHTKQKLRSRVFWLAASAPAVFVLACFAGGIVLCEVAMHVPRRTVAGVPAGGAIRAVEIRARDGIRLRAWMVPPSQPTSNCVIVLHGIGDSRQSALGFAPLFTAHRYAVLAPDSRSHGESGGDFVTYGVLEADDPLILARRPSSTGGAMLLAVLPVEVRARSARGLAGSPDRSNPHSDPADPRARRQQDSAGAFPNPGHPESLGCSVSGTRPGTHQRLEHRPGRVRAAGFGMVRVLD